jgi:UMF1 family MFS transporter
MSSAEKSWILYDFANSSYGLIVITTIMPIYYKSHIVGHLPDTASTADWGFANAAAGLIIALLAPVLGAVADVKRQKKMFLFVFLCLGVLFTASFSFMSEGMRLTTLIFYVFSLIGFAGGNVFYDSLLVDVTTKRRMDWISGAGYAWGYLGGALPFILCIVLIWWGDQFGLSLAMTRGAFLLTAVWWAVFSIPVLRNTRQKYIIRSKEKSVMQALRNLLETLRKIRSYRNIVLFLLAYFLYIDGVDTIIRMAVPYGQDAGLSPRVMLGTILGLQLLAFPFALLYGRLAEIFSARKMLYTAICVYIVIAFCGYLIPDLRSIEHRGALFFVLAFLISTSQGGIQALSRSYFGKLIPKEQAAEFFGFYNIFGKFATILGPLLIALAARLLGQPKYGILSLVFLFVAGGILLYFVKDENEEAEKS